MSDPVKVIPIIDMNGYPMIGVLPGDIQRILGFPVSPAIQAVIDQLADPAEKRFGFPGYVVLDRTGFIHMLLHLQQQTALSGGSL